MKNKTPLVSVIIPCHNKKDTIACAIQSVKEQTFDNLECIVVFDNDEVSLDNTKSAIGNDNRFSTLNVNNGNVADTRNDGIKAAVGKYICCLDGDDYIAPEYLETLIPAIDGDMSLGIVYTGITAHSGDKEELSEWPPQQCYDKQIQRYNQIPTCNVFRRDIWERTGGFRRRYCPNGAGSEDAAFWTMFGAMGYRAEKVTDDGLFHYSIYQGNVSGNKNYREVDWLGWYPYVADKFHPFFSIATPLNKISHIAMEYDEPIISIVIPVGEGHENNARDAIDSIDAQSFRQWEIVLVNDTGSDDAFGAILKAYPFVKLVSTGGKMGAGFARNRGVEAASGDFIFFLDADDLMNVSLPNAFHEMLEVWNETQSAVYSDYLGRVFIDDVSTVDKKNIVRRDDDGETWIYHRTYNYDCEKASNEPSKQLYIWNLISTLFPRQWHFDVGGFDETMETWEDWDYWIRMAKAGKCFVRMPEPYLIYKFYTGKRRDLAHKRETNGRQKAESVLKYLIGKHKGIDDMACKTCGGNKNRVAQKKVYSEKDINVVGDYKLVTYMHRNKGMHRVIGAKTKTDYGHHKGNGQERFKVHVDDIKVTPHLFVEVRREVKKPVQVVKPTPPPTPKVKNTPRVKAKPVTQVEVINKFGLAPFDVFDAPGIGKKAGDALIEAGYITEDSILKASLEDLSMVKHISFSKAKTLKKFAKIYKANFKK